jgi:hypothetical protein
VQSNLSIAASRCVYGDNVELDVAFDHNKSLQEIGFDFGALKNVRAVDLDYAALATDIRLAQS